MQIVMANANTGTVVEAAAGENFPTEAALEAMRQGVALADLLPETLALAAEQGRKDDARQRLNTAEAAAREAGLLDVDTDTDDYRTDCVTGFLRPRTFYATPEIALAAALAHFLEQSAHEQVEILFQHDGAEDSFAISVASREFGNRCLYHARAGLFGDVFWADFAHEARTHVIFDEFVERDDSHLR